MDNKKFIVKKTLRVTQKIQELGLPLLTTKKQKTFEFLYDVRNYTDQYNNRIRKLAIWAEMEGIEWHII